MPPPAPDDASAPAGDTAGATSAIVISASVIRAGEYRFARTCLLYSHSEVVTENLVGDRARIDDQCAGAELTRLVEGIVRGGHQRDRVARVQRTAGDTERHADVEPLRFE